MTQDIVPLGALWRLGAAAPVGHLYAESDVSVAARLPVAVAPLPVRGRAHPVVWVWACPPDQVLEVKWLPCNDTMHKYIFYIFLSLFGYVWEDGMSQAFD